jgi:hypothetical protein
MAQQFKPVIISSGGGTVSNQNAMMTFTIGEPVTGIISNNTSIVSQGFQQKTGPGVGIVENFSNNSISFYPNPASDIVNIKFEKGIPEKSVIELVDIGGKIIMSQNVESNKTESQINLSKYPENIYLIRISTQTGKFLCTFKIQKIK